jgi:hypothetical protein
MGEQYEFMEVFLNCNLYNQSTTWLARLDNEARQHNWIIDT